MKKRVLFICLLLVCIPLLFWATSQSTLSTKDSPYDHINIDRSKDIVLNFNNNWVRVEAWNENYIRVKSNLYSNLEYCIEIAAADNTIRAVQPSGNNKKSSLVYTSWPWLPLMQFDKYRPLFDVNSTEYPFIVYVPENVPVHITGDYIRTEGCTVASVKGGTAVIRRSTLAKSFQEQVESLTVRDSKIPNGINLQNKKGEIRDNIYID